MYKIAEDLHEIIETAKGNEKYYIRDSKNYTIKEIEKESIKELIENETIDDIDEVIEIVEIPGRDIVLISGMVSSLDSWLSGTMFYLTFNVREYIYTYIITKTDYNKRKKDIKGWVYFSE